MHDARRLKSVVVASDDIDTVDAVQELIDKSLVKLNGNIPKAALVYFGIDTEAEVLSAELLKTWPDIQIIGCSTWGEMSPEYGTTQDGIVLCLFCSETHTFRSYSINLSDVSEFEIDVECLTDEIRNTSNKLGQEPSLCLTLTDVLSFSNIETVLEELHRALPKTTFFGGAAADNWTFEGIKLLCNDAVSKSGCVLLCFYGDLDVTVAVDSGWDSRGKRGRVNASHHNVIKEIDGKPALEFYSDSFGSNVKPEGSLPLYVYHENGDPLFLRTCYGNYDEQSGEVTFLGRVPEGSTVELSAISHASMLRGVQNSVEGSVSDFPSSFRPSLAILSSCAARRAIFGSKVGEEVKILQSILGDEIDYLGYYTYGEISPNATNSPPLFHNQTFATLLLG